MSTKKSTGLCNNLLGGADKAAFPLPYFTAALVPA